MRDVHGVDLGGREVPEQPRQHGEPGIQQQSEPVVLDQEASACPTGRRPHPAATEHRQSHAPTLGRRVVISS
jgi:hypothetical protein